METKMNQLINQLSAKQLIKQNNPETIKRGIENTLDKA